MILVEKKRFGMFWDCWMSGVYFSGCHEHSWMIYKKGLWDDNLWHGGLWDDNDKVMDHLCNLSLRV